MDPALPDLGVGIVWWPGLDEVLATPDVCDVVEIEPQAFWLEVERGGRLLCPDAVIDELRALPQRKLLHGVGTPVGSPRCIEPRQLPLLRQLREALQPAWCSEHLGINRAQVAGDTVHTGFFLPPRQTVDGAAAACAAIRLLRTALDAPLLIETGTNYLRPRADELADGEFTALVANGADCGILLDLHNVWANECNGRQRAREFVASLPLDRVVELHLAGGVTLDGFWLDAHCDVVPAPVMELAAELVPRLPNLRAVIFEVLPEHVDRLGTAAIVEQLRRLRRLWQARGTGAGSHRPAGRNACPPVCGPSPAEWEDTLASLVLGRVPANPLAKELIADPGVPLLRRLVAEFRAGAVAATLPWTCRLLAGRVGEPRLRELLRDHARHDPPTPFAITEGVEFAATLARVAPRVPGLDAVLRWELATLTATLRGEAAPPQPAALHDLLAVAAMP